MITRLRIAVAADDLATRDLLQDSLQRLGHQVETVATAQDLADLCRGCGIHLVIAEFGLPPAGGLHAAQEIYKSRPVPMIVILESGNELEAFSCAASPYIFGFLTKPIHLAVLGPAIGLAEHRFRELQILRQETNGLRQALCDRKLIERAKGIVMRHGNIEEAEAFRLLQRLARNKSKKLAEIAETIVTADEARKTVGTIQSGHS